MRRRAVLIGLASCGLAGYGLTGCGPTVSQETAALTLAPDSLAVRQIQTRRFDTADEQLMLRASAAVLQDLGFSIDETTPGAGLIIGSATRSALGPRQLGGQKLASLLGAPGGWGPRELIRVSIITQALGGGRGVTVRATFQRVLGNGADMAMANETINDPMLYQAFFDRLAQSAFLEAHAI